MERSVIIEVGEGARRAVRLDDPHVLAGQVLRVWDATGVRNRRHVFIDAGDVLRHALGFVGGV